MAAEKTLTLPTDTDVWPSLPLEAWRDTYATLHMWTQVIGKIRLALAPMVCHWWQVTLYVTSRGLTTSPIPYGTRLFQIDFDFLDPQLLIQTADGETRSLALAPRSVAEFYRETMAALRSLGIEVGIWTTPVEVADRTPFEKSSVCHFHRCRPDAHLDAERSEGRHRFPIKFGHGAWRERQGAGFSVRRLNQ